MYSASICCQLAPLHFISFQFFLLSSSPHPFIPPCSLPLLTYSSFNQLPCSSPAVLCSFCCSSQWIFDAVKCVTGWEMLAPPTFSLSLPVSPPIIYCLPVSLSHSTAESASVQWSELTLSPFISPLPHCIFLPCFLLSPLPPLFNQSIVSYIERIGHWSKKNSFNLSFKQKHLCFSNSNVLSVSLTTTWW